MVTSDENNDTQQIMESIRTPRRACKDVALARIFASSVMDEDTKNCINMIETKSKPSRSYSISGQIHPKRGSSYVSYERQSKHDVCTPSSSPEWQASESSSSSEESSPSSSSSPSESDDDDHDENAWSVAVSTPGRRRRGRCPTVATATSRRPTPFSLLKTPSSIPRRAFSLQPRKPATPLNRRILQDDFLPEREQEFSNICTFVTGKLSHGTGGCMYISGLPGTGKTASVQAALRFLSTNDGPTFQTVLVNGMQVNDPKQVYVLIYQQLTGQVVSAVQAVALLEREFCTVRSKGGKAGRSGPGECSPVVLVIDELDTLCTRRQEVLYNLFDWPSRPRGRRCLVVLTIANTMDLPERMLHPRVASRLGLTRLTFAPYSHQQLVGIIRAHLAPECRQVFQPKALELAARKVAAVSGDVRRALEICRRAVELAGPKSREVSMDHIDQALKEMFTSPKSIAISACSMYEKLFLRALIAEFQARSSEEACLGRCIQQMSAICHLEGEEDSSSTSLTLVQLHLQLTLPDDPPTRAKPVVGYCRQSVAGPTTSEVFTICASLGAHKLLLTEALRNDTSTLVRLNCAKSDVLFCLKQ